MRLPMSSRANWVSSATIVVALFVFCVGCSQRDSSGDLKTYPVSGSVVDKTGKPVTGGAIQFRSIDSGGQAALVELKPDGSFSLTTIVDGKKIPGAVEGNHEVTYFPVMTEAQTEAPVTLKEQVKVEPKDGNSFTIKLP